VAPAGILLNKVKAEVKYKSAQEIKKKHQVDHLTSTAIDRRAACFPHASHSQATKGMQCHCSHFQMPQRPSA